MVRFSDVLSEGWNRCTRGSIERRAERNRAAFDGYAETGHVHGQRRGAVARLPYGKFTMDYNGCEVIACHNALLTAGAESTLADTAAWFERRGTFLAGKWGSHVEAIPRFFRSRGLAPRTLYASSVKDPAAYDAFFAGGRAAVFSFWNSAKRLRDGVHTIALAHGADGGLVIYNLYGTDARENTAFRSITEFVGKTGVLPILLVVV